MPFRSKKDDKTRLQHLSALHTLSLTRQNPGAEFE